MKRRKTLFPIVEVIGTDDFPVCVLVLQIRSIRETLIGGRLGTVIEYANGDELLCADQTQDVVAMVRAAWLPVADWLARQ